ncbi:signal peptidase I [Nonomuraea sp. NPDC052116]|uniref:signal peptidase I n=1 Tax=Nonomuraea sp. NPDC052116 TaxID=3155665 RepID=UPI003414198B
MRFGRRGRGIALAGLTVRDNAPVIRVRTTALSLFLLLASTAGCGGVGTFTITMSGESMEPTIKAGANLSPRSTDGQYAPHLGDVIVYRTPKNWANATPGELHVSRVIGVPGSTVNCCDPQGRLQVNGKALDEPYLAAPPASHLRFEVQVPPSRLWVMSDNRHAALDSRTHLADPGNGTIDISDVAGVVDPARR